ncbi:TPA: hypothetical protein DD449_02690 [Candidatus Berkelbacteria bacterium]|nr:hypothetical protein [Candidatus Berkelbacteria bacterium]
MSKKLVTSLILILLTLNFGAGYFIYYSARVKADNLGTSAKNAVGSVSTQNANLFGLNTAALPKTDVSGEDPVGTTRYPKAVRVSFLKAADGTVAAEYKVLAPVNVVLSYFKTQLAKESWIISASSSDSIVFFKNAQNVSISGTNDSGVTTYKIVLK